jgi:hypothetical protein
VSASLAFVVGLSVVAPATGSARTSTSSEASVLVALAGSSQYLVYAEFTVNPQTNQPVSPGRLEVLSRSGQTRWIGNVGKRSLDTFSLAGSTLFFIDPRGHPRLPAELVNLRTGSIRREPGGLTAAPDGLLDIRPQQAPPYADQLVDVPVKGPARLLGVSFPARQHYVVRSGGASYTAFTPDTGTKGGVVAGSLTGTPHRRALVRAGRHWVSCGVPTDTAVVCEVVPFTGGTKSLRLYTISGRLVARATSYCQPGGLTAVPASHSAFWVSCSGRLFQLASDGSVTHSTHAFARRAPVAALGKVIVTSRSKTRLLAVTSARGTGATVVHTTGSRPGP